MKRVLCLVILFLLLQSLPLWAQQEDFEQLRRELRSEFEDFRKEANREYADFLNRAWKEFTFLPGKEPDRIPKPLHPIYRQEEEREIQVQVSAPPAAVASIVNRETKDEQRLDVSSQGTPFQVSYYGMDVQMHYQSVSFRLPSVGEKEVASLWRSFSQTTFTSLLSELLDCKERMQMNDGAYLKLIQKTSAEIPTLMDENKRVIFQQFLLVQSGYDVRLARVNDFLVLLLPIPEEVYRHPYLLVDGRQYYLFSERTFSSETKLFTYELPPNIERGKFLSLRFGRELLLPMKPHAFKIEAGGLTVQGEVNTHKIEFYKDYPACELAVYASVMPDKQLHRQLMTSLSSRLTGKNTLVALNQLLSWVQHGFGYKTDQQQFGEEKPFFVDEIFFYPYCDCEDRSILFSYLVRHLLKKKTVLLDYPGHVSTAVCLGTDVRGASVIVKNEKYIMCDPTFVGASAGTCMPDYRSKMPKLIEQ